jgi:hypothetical protein
MSITFCISEVDAKTKWCPFVGMTRFNHQSEECIASACMAWRWVGTHISDGQDGLTPSNDTHGYCGLAGDPTGARAAKAGP